MPATKPPGAMVNWGFIGCGAVTEVKGGPAFARTPGSRIHGVYAPRADRAADWAARHGVEVTYPSIDTLLADDRIDAVYIATRPDSHLTYVRKVLDTGKPMVVERPMGRTAEEARLIDTAARAAGVAVAVPYYRRYLPRFRRARLLLRDGRIGRVTSFTYRFSQPAHRAWGQAAQDWRFQPEISGGGIFRDMAGHALDLIDFLIGPVTRAARFDALHTADASLRLERSVAMALAVGDGITGTASWSLAAGVREDCLDILGTAGRLRVRLYLDHLVCVDTPDESVRYADPDPEHVYSPFVRDVVDGLLAGAGLSTTAEALRTAIWLDRTLPGDGGEDR